VGPYVRGPVGARKAGDVTQVAAVTIKLRLKKKSSNDQASPVSPPTNLSLGRRPALNVVTRSKSTVAAPVEVKLHAI
jgi:hypothetical protein